MAEANYPKQRVLLVDGSKAVINTLTEIISAVEELKVIGTASAGQEAIRRALDSEPDIVLMDINLPDADGIQVAWTLSSRLPNCSVIVVSSDESSGMIQRAMLAGAQAYLTKPVNRETVIQTIRNVRGRHFDRVSKLLNTPPSVAHSPDRRGKCVVIFGAKGGVGKTTIASNLAVAMRQRTKKEIALIDADFYFGDMGLHMNVASKNTVVDLLPRVSAIDEDLLEQVMAVHSSGIRVLLGPPRPEMAEVVTVDHIEHLLDALPNFYDYVIVDCQHYYDDRMLAVLDHSDLIVLVLTPEIGPVRNSKHFLRLASAVGLDSNILVVLNRSDSNVGIGVPEIERALGIERMLMVPSGGRAIATSVNEGNNIVISSPRTPYARSIMEIAAEVQNRLGG